MKTFKGVVQGEGEHFIHKARGGASYALILGKKVKVEYKGGEFEILKPKSFRPRSGTVVKAIHRYPWKF